MFDHEAPTLEDAMEEAKQTIELRQSLHDAVDYNTGQRLYKEHIETNLDQIFDDNVQKMARKAWETDFLALAEYIKMRQARDDSI